MSRVKLLDGYTLTHEHMTIDLSPGDLGTTSFDPLVRDLKMVYKCGVRNIIDMTNQSMGRNPEYVQRLMDMTGINIILSTGYYLEHYIKDYVENATVSELSQQAVNDLTSGIQPKNIVIGHIEFYPNDEALKSLLKKGVYIGLDMIGKRGRSRDEYRADIVRKVKDWGFLSQLTLSLDICRTEDLRTSGNYGYVYLFDTFIPLLKERGITQDDIDLILEENPAKIFALRN